jgi:hypothetical protein
MKGKNFFMNIEKVPEKVRRKIALELFGTEDYEKVLEVIAPSSEMMRIFIRKLEEYSKEIENGY